MLRILSYTFLLLIFSTPLLATVETFINFVEVAPPIVGDPITFTVADDKFHNPAEWATIEEHHRIDNRIIFQVNEESLRQQPTVAQTYTLTFELMRWFDNGTTAVEMETLDIHYDPDAATTTTHQTFLELQDAFRVDVKIINITSDSTMYFPDFLVYAEILIERTYLFDCVAVPTFLHGQSEPAFAIQEETGEILVNWDFLQGAEYYDLEWTFYDQEGPIGNNAGNAANTVPDNLEELFANNTTRVTISAEHQSYLLKNLYPAGYLFFRIRGVRYLQNGTREHGAWSSSGNVILYNFPDKLLVSWHEENLNWQASVIYAEEGKHKAAINYFDGALRNRQSATHLGSEKIISQTLYDHYGRPVIQTLPAPGINGIALNFESDFLQATDGTPYTKNKHLLSSPTATPEPMGQGNGPARYYGSQRFGILGAENSTLSYQLPDSEGYPFSMTEYTPDQTGRIMRQSGVGGAFKIGSGHETRYYYGKPAQEELDRMFGNDVGFNSHYFVNMVEDPNGQLSVSYLDAHGRTVATSLAGEKPTTVDALDNITAPETINIDLLQEAGHSLSSTYSLLVRSEGDYDFSYQLNNQGYLPKCLPPGICYSCIYDVKIIISDYEGNTFNGGEPFIINTTNLDLGIPPTVDVSCTAVLGIQEDFLHVLPVGQYQVTRQVTLNQTALRLYLEDYLTREECLPDFDAILADYLAEITITDCEYTTQDCLNDLGDLAAYTATFASDIGLTAAELSPEQEAIAAAEYDLLLAECQLLDGPDECTIYRQLLEKDMFPTEVDLANLELGMDGCPLAPPPGQYAWYYWNESGEFTPTDDASIFNLDAQGLPRYSNLDFSPYTVVFEGNEVSPATLAPEDFVELWNPAWAETLVQLHPEYCYIGWCESDNSRDFDRRLRETTSFAEALDDTNDNELVGTDGLIYLEDPFFQTGGLGEGQECLQEMLDHYAHINPDDLDSPALLDWITDIVYGPNCGFSFGMGTSAQNDQAWQRLRGFYLGIKEKIRRDKLPADCPGQLCGEEETGDLVFALGDACFIGGRASVPLTTENFVDLVDFSFSIVYDDNALIRQSHTINPDNDPDLNGFAVTVDDSTPGIIQVSWNETSGLTLTDGSRLIVFYFIPNGNESTSVVAINNESASNNTGPVNGIDVPQASTVQSCTSALSSSGPEELCCKILRFGYSDDLPEDIDFTDALAELTRTEEAIQEAVAANCEAMREVWKQQIKVACPTISKPDIEWILDELVEVCSLGGDAAHPFGASTTPIIIVNGEAVRAQTGQGYSSFAEVLSAVTSTNTCPEFNPYLINFPAPYEQVTYNGPRTIVSKANTCACDQLKYLEACYQNDNQAYEHFEDYLARYSNANLFSEDLAMLQTACNAMSGDDQSSYLPRPIALPPYLDCGVCKTCDDLQPLVAAYNEINTTGPSEDYYRELTDYLNYYLGFNLEIADYQDFLAECSNGTLTCREATLLCPTSPYDTQVDPSDLSDCVEEAIAAATTQAQITYDYLLEQYEQDFINEYLTKCGNLNESFDVLAQYHEYQTTLYYYDQAGNLVKTVPPKGYEAITDQPTLDQVNEYRNEGHGNPAYPSHKMVTSYQYNSLGQVVAKIMPDTEVEYYWYDELGRMIASQDGRQRGMLPARFSYTLYDPLGRVTEVGEVDGTLPLFGLLLNISTNRVNYYEFSTIINESTDRFSITRTYYDEAPFTITIFDPQSQENLRNRVATITFQDTYSTNSNYDYATHYSYDITGNVKTLVQDLTPLANTGHQWKRIDYDYDFLSGNVNAVYYQKGANDQFTHRYEYDGDNRLTNVYTSPVSTDADVHSPIWEQDASYTYYDHGSLARTLMGERAVQGMDYAYTLQGWIKGVNSSALVPDRDMGRDGAENAWQPGSTRNLNIYVAQDAFAYTLGYFSGDFNPVGGIEAKFELATAGTTFDDNSSLYNGNIRHMVMQSMGLAGGATGARYHYDQLHRIKTMDTYALEASVSNYTWGTGLTSRGYSSNYTYDPNGNLLTLNRTADGTLMDQLTYTYDDLQTSNLLRQVGDNVPPGALDHDFDGQGANNYSYDGSGNLTYDAQGDASLTWNPYGKVEQIAFGGGNGNPARNTFFDYGPDQNRISKTYVTPGTNEVKTTFYVRDAQGNTMAVYERDAAGDIHWQEQHLYGSSRLGLWRPGVTWANNTFPPATPYFSAEEELQTGWKTYELSNHLGNVAATISDRRTSIDSDTDGYTDYYEPVVRSASEYYPFGLTMEGRSTNFNGYRFGFNGKEADTQEEWGSATHYDYGFRIYNPSIARFLSVDPLAPNYPWYTPYQFAGNNPIKFIDLDGLEPTIKQLFEYPITTPDDTDIKIAVGAITTWTHGTVTSFDIEWWDFDGKLTFEWSSAEGAYINAKYGSYSDWANKWIEAEGDYLTFKTLEYAHGVYDLVEGIITDPIETGEHILTHEFEANDLDFTDVWINPRVLRGQSRTYMKPDGSVEYHYTGRDGSTQVIFDNRAKKPSYVNPGHHDPTNPNFRGGGSARTELLPENHQSLWERAVPDVNGPLNSQSQGLSKNWYAKDANGNIHRFQTDPNNQAHWSGSTKGDSGLQVPARIKRQLNEGG